MLNDLPPGFKLSAGISILIVCLGLLTLAGYALFSDRATPEPGPQAARDYAHEYISALNANDRDSVAELVGDHTGPGDIQERLTVYGGRGLTVIDITLIQDIADHYRVWITARDQNGTEVEMYQVFCWEGKKWSMDALNYAPFPPKSD